MTSSEIERENQRVLARAPLSDPANETHVPREEFEGPQHWSATKESFERVRAQARNKKRRQRRAGKAREVILSYFLSGATKRLRAGNETAAAEERNQDTKPANNWWSFLRFREFSNGYCEIFFDVDTDEGSNIIFVLD